jgi:hypothetical protein
MNRNRGWAISMSDCLSPKAIVNRQRLEAADVSPTKKPATGTKHPRLLVLIGGHSRDRTYDPLIKSQLLYQLSYVPVSRFDDRK